MVCAGLVFAMAIIGAITRLTESGLSMVEWRPLIGIIPPLNDAEWQRVFDLYRETPEYRLKNAGMTLAAFREIFFWEWLHRLWGRMIGLAFALPLVWFWLRGRIDGALARTLIVILALGALQAGIGWFMVQSGLVDRPAVSQYRLALHLGMAVLIYALLVWLSFGAFATGSSSDRAAPPRRFRHHGWAAIAVLGVTILWGAFVAGLDAGLAYNSFPLMAGRFLPPEAWTLNPAWINFFENTALVQFTHRWVAIAAALAIVALPLHATHVHAEPSVRRAAAAAAIMALVQVGLGIATLLAHVPVALGAAHQAGALILLTLTLRVVFVARGR